MEPEEQLTAPKKGSYEQYAQLSQSLSQTIMQHYFATHGGQNATPLPPYIVETIQSISSTLATLANDDPFDTQEWQNLASQPLHVVAILNSKEQ